MSDELNNEISEGGAEILRHEARESSSEAASSTPYEEEIVAHVEQHVGPVESVFHELVSERVHLDLHLVPATKERRFHFVFTTGMSAAPMNAPDEQWRFAEMCVLLPPDWPLDQQSWQDERFYWPLRWLKILARLPHEYDTWLGLGHTVPNGNPPQPFVPGTALCCAMLLPPLELPEAFARMSLSDGNILNFWNLVPLHLDEMRFKLDKNLGALLQQFERRGISDIINPGRESALRVNKLAGWFGR